MKNKIIIKSQNILSFDQQVEQVKDNRLSIIPFMAEYFRGKITPSRYLHLTKQYKE